VDLAGYTKLFHTLSDQEVADFLDRYYALCERVVTGAGGRVVKFIGDGCLAMFSAEEATAAVNAAVELLRAVDELAEAANIGVKLGANVHLTTVVAGYFGAEGQYFDVIGRGVNQTFLLGRGPGIRLSEPVYRKLPSAARSAWDKHKPPQLYTLTDSAGLLEALGKSTGANTARW
jgi:class 3 adenylate cyclase